jgi:carbon storage regulator CsrA
MLALTRKSDESLTIGTESDALGPIIVTVLSITGNCVKLGFQMDRSIPVFRSEIWQRIQNDSIVEKAH